MKQYELNDVGLANRFKDRHGDDFRFVARFNRWMGWTDTGWTFDETGALERAIMDLLSEMKKAANEMPDRQRAKMLWDHAHKYQGHKKIRDIIAMAQSLPGMTILPDALDTHPMLLGVGNGIINLKTGELLPHRREYLITRSSSVEFHRDAQCPTWMDYLNCVFDGSESLIRFSQRMLGYMLTGLTTERCLFIFYGTGANGKSTFLSIAKSLMGDYAVQAPAGMLLQKRNEGIPNDVARLKGARFVPAIETDEDKRLAESFVKQATGGEDMLTARFMRGEWFDFKPEFKLFIATNHKPEIRGTDNGIWDRIRLVPFTVTIPAGDRDPDLADKLRRELSGILAWAVQGCLEWQADGLGVPKEVSEATRDYRDDMDGIGDFIAAECVKGSGLEAKAGDLYESYRIWCRLSGEEPVSQRRFGEQLRERGFDSRKSGAKLWVGIGLKASNNGNGDFVRDLGTFRDGFSG